MIPAFNKTMSDLNSDKTGPVTFNKTVPTLDVSLATMGRYVNESVTGSGYNETRPILDFSVTMPSLEFNQTTLDTYSNETNLTFDLDTANIPITGLAYTLFGLTCGLTLLGLIGNALILTSMFKFKDKSQGHGKLLTSLAICDSLALVSITLVQPCVQDVFGLDIRALSTIGCKISWAFLLSAVSCSSGVVVLICLERFVAVWFPLKSRSLLSERNILTALLVCVTPLTLIFVATSVLYVEIKAVNCIPNFAGIQYSTVLNSMPDTTFYNATIGFILVTFMLILSVFTPLTIIKLYKQMSKRCQLTNNGPNAQVSATEFKTSVKLISVVIAQVALTGFPVVVTAIFGTRGVQIEQNARSALNLAIQLNHAINFILYNVYDAEFRRNILALLGYVKKGKTPALVMVNLKAGTAGDTPKDE